MGHQPPSPATGHGTLSPPLLSHTPGSNRTGSVGSGSRLAIAKASISSCTSSGTLRSNSTYAVQMPRSSTCGASRPMPMSVPSTTEKMAAGTAARTVLISPARNARQNGWFASKFSQPSLIEKPAGSVRKSKPERTPRARSTSSAW